MAEALTAKVVAWEKERGVKFEYDGVRLARTCGCSCRNREIRSRMRILSCLGRRTAGGAAGHAGGVQQREEGEGAGAEEAAGPEAAAGRGAGAGRVAGGPAAAQEHQERDEDAVHGRQRQQGGAVVEARHAELPQVAHVRAAGRQRRGPDDGVRLLRVSG